MKNAYGNVACGGMDVHYKFSTVTFRDKAGRVVRRERLEHAPRDRLRERLQRWPQGAPIVLEASFGWGWLSDLLEEAGLEPHLSNCYKLEQMRKARGWVKTNRKDADLVSLLPFETSTWWEVWRAPAEVRNQREQMRFRADLVELQTRVKNRIHALFHRHGIFHAFSDLFGGQGRAFLAELCLHNPTGLPPEALLALRGQVKLLDHVRGQLAGVERILHRQWVTTPLVRRLKTIPGIGLVLAHVLAAEIGRIERFGSHKKLASYSLLAPRAADTGEADSASAPLGRHLGTRGNRTLKWAFIEAAHAAVRSGGRWRALFDRVTQGGRKDRNRGYIKVARELVKVVYGVWAKGVAYKPLAPARPGSEKHRKQSRSGTGQLCHPLVHALPA
ncbi:MAG TPA: IS110 family transposase [Sedimentisphaerales bacterium]|nr:IS110 family transposase [Sedimentisphaerales bacterium]